MIPIRLRELLRKELRHLLGMVERRLLSFPELLIVGLRAEPRGGVMDIEGAPHLDVEGLLGEVVPSVGLQPLPGADVFWVEEIVVPCHVGPVLTGPILPLCLCRVFHLYIQ